MTMNRTLIFSALSALALAACAPKPATGPALKGEAETSATPAADDIMPAAFEDHLPWNADAEGVTNLGDGLQYIVLEKGPEGGKKPAATDIVLVHYEGRLPTGEKFDSSFDRGAPASFRLNQVIPGWTMGVQAMSEGDEFLFYVPNALAYGNETRGDVIKAGDDLVFRVQLVAVLELEAHAQVPKYADAAAWQKYFPWNPDAPEVVKTESGLQYVVLASGDASGRSPTGEQFAVVHYEGRLASTGVVFDSTYERSEPAAFQLNGLAPGGAEVLAAMKPGDRWMVYVPSDLGYGKEGTPGGPIPPDADLQFEFELISVMP